jgi:hypothetical protein
MGPQWLVGRDKQAGSYKASEGRMRGLFLAHRLPVGGSDSAQERKLDDGHLHGAG